MKNQIVRFENRDDIRVINDSELGVLFCAKDVCNVLGYANSRKAIADNCNQSGVTASYISYPSGKKLATFINEANLYRLTMRSKLKGAVKFQDWIAEEILPSIRKNGFYADTTQKLTNLSTVEIFSNMGDFYQMHRLRMDKALDGLPLKTDRDVKRYNDTLERTRTMPIIGVVGNCVCIDWKEGYYSELDKETVKYYLSFVSKTLNLKKPLHYFQDVSIKYDSDNPKQLAELLVLEAESLF